MHPLTPIIFMLLLRSYYYGGKNINLVKKLNMFASLVTRSFSSETTQVADFGFILVKDENIY